MVSSYSIKANWMSEEWCVSRTSVQCHQCGERDEVYPWWCVWTLCGHGPGFYTRPHAAHIYRQWEQRGFHFDIRYISKVGYCTETQENKSFFGLTLCLYLWSWAGSGTNAIVMKGNMIILDCLHQHHNNNNYDTLSTVHGGWLPESRCRLPMSLSPGTTYQSPVWSLNKTSP